MVRCEGGVGVCGKVGEYVITCRGVGKCDGACRVVEVCGGACGNVGERISMNERLEECAVVCGRVCVLVWYPVCGCARQHQKATTTPGKHNVQHSLTQLQQLTENNYHTPTFSSLRGVLIKNFNLTNTIAPNSDPIFSIPPKLQLARNKHHTLTLFLFIIVLVKIIKFHSTNTNISNPNSILCAFPKPIKQLLTHTNAPNIPLTNKTTPGCTFYLHVFLNHYTSCHTTSCLSLFQNLRKMSSTKPQETNNTGPDMEVEDDIEDSSQEEEPNNQRQEDNRKSPSVRTEEHTVSTTPTTGNQQAIQTQTDKVKGIVPTPTASQSTSIVAYSTYSSSSKKRLREGSLTSVQPNTNSSSSFTVPPPPIQAEADDEFEEYFNQIQNLQQDSSAEYWIRRIVLTPAKFPTNITTATAVCEILSQDAIIHHFASTYGPINDLHTKAVARSDNTVLIAVAFQKKESWEQAANYNDKYGTAMKEESEAEAKNVHVHRAFIVTDTTAVAKPTTEQVKKAVEEHIIRKNQDPSGLSVNINAKGQYLAYFPSPFPLFTLMDNPFISQGCDGTFYLRCVTSLCHTSDPRIFRLFCVVDTRNPITNQEIRNFFKAMKGYASNIWVPRLRSWGLV